MRGYLHDVICDKGVYDFIFVQHDSERAVYEKANAKSIRLDLTKPMAMLTYADRPVPCQQLDASYSTYFKRTLTRDRGNWIYAFARAVFITYDYAVSRCKNGYFTPECGFTFEGFLSTAFKWLEQAMSLCKSTDKKQKEVERALSRKIFNPNEFEWRIGKSRDFNINCQMINTSPIEIFKDLSIYPAYQENHSWTYYNIEETFEIYRKTVPTKILRSNLKDFQKYKDESNTIDKMTDILTHGDDTLLQPVLSTFTAKDWYNLNKILAEVHPMTCLGNQFMQYGIGLFKACHLLDRQLDSGSIFKQAIIVAKEYEQAQTLLNKELIDECNNYFKDCQTKGINLNFEDTNYKVIVPTTYQELVEMGKLMHNCLADHEWSNILTTGRRRVVFIQPKDKNIKKHIACDIDVQKGSIEQFLTDYNDSVDEDDFPDIEDFQESYEEYIQSQYFLDCEQLPALDEKKARKIKEVFSSMKTDNYVKTLTDISIKLILKD